MTSVGQSSQRSYRVREWAKKLLTYWTLIAIVSAIALAIFADVGEDVAEKSTGTFDNAVRAWFLAHQNPTLYKIAAVLTWIGSPTVMVIVAIAAGVWFYRSRGRSKAGVLVAAPAVLAQAPLWRTSTDLDGPAYDAAVAASHAIFGAFERLERALIEDASLRAELDLDPSRTIEARLVEAGLHGASD